MGAVSFGQPAFLVIEMNAKSAASPACASAPGAGAGEGAGGSAQFRKTSGRARLRFGKSPSRRGATIPHATRAGQKHTASAGHGPHRRRFYPDNRGPAAPLWGPAAARQFQKDRATVTFGDSPADFPTRSGFPQIVGHAPGPGAASRTFNPCAEKNHHRDFQQWPEFAAAALPETASRPFRASSCPSKMRLGSGPGRSE